MASSPASMAEASSSRPYMHPVAAKTLAAATGATMTALTMTPFDVIKTRLQTQPLDGPSSSSGAGSSSSFASTSASSSRGGVVCCQPANVPCVRYYSTIALQNASSTSYAPSSRAYFDFRSGRPPQVVCLWDAEGHLRSERCTGFWDAALKVWRAEGVRGLWKGVGTTLVIAVPAQTVYMVTYDTLRKTLPLPTTLDPTSSVTPLVSGILARTIVSSLSSPLELLRTRLQSTPPDPSVPHTLRSTLAGIRTMVGKEGVISLYKGLGPTLWRDVPFSGLYWAGFEGLKRKLKRRGYDGTGVTFVSGAVSGTTAAILTSPFDVLKTRRQALLQTVATQSSSSTSSISTATVPLIRQIIRTEGVKALYAGLTPRIAKIAPACGIMISCYEGVERYFDVRMLD
ncbi:hypothetical protein FRC01_010498 [Tulasnella sp. 417]|nr:hypothetical protein FRC01_010498 [Tulasnella sp. 417]